MTESDKDTKTTTTRSYVKFSAKGDEGDCQETKQKQCLPGDVASSVYGVDSSKFGSWGGFCSWCLVIARATHAVVVDPHGLVVARDGDLPDAEGDALGRWVWKMMSQGAELRLAQGELHVLAAEFEAGWFSGIFFQGDDQDRPMMVGVRSAKPLFHQARQAIVTQALYTLKNL